jgi:hypothetical protein
MTGPLGHRFAGDPSGLGRRGMGRAGGKELDCDLLPRGYIDQGCG